MIAISSARSHEKSAEYAINQTRARKSWDVFSSIFYCSPYEKDLCWNQVLTVRSEPWPTIKQMAEFASHMTDLTCLINADIIVTPEIKVVEAKMKELTIPAATSYRYEYEPDDYPDLSKAIRCKEDRGMDIFVATPEVWKLVAQRIPTYLRIGHQTFDSWLCGFFCANFGFGFRQFTDYRCVFHPKHEGRETPHSSEIKSDDEYFTRAHVPSPL